MTWKSIFDTGAVLVLGAIAALLWIFYDVYQWMWGGL